MPIYEFLCSCGKSSTVFTHKILSASSKNCSSCGRGMRLNISDSLFVAPESDLTFVGNRVRMQEGIFYDQDAKTRKRGEEKNDEAAHKNQISMGRQGFTEK